AGAGDSAAGLYSLLPERYPGSRWASLAGLKSGIIHLQQDRYSLAYRTLSDWIGRHAYADNPEAEAALAEASFLTGRYAKAWNLLQGFDSAVLEDQRRAKVFDCYKIRALARLGSFAVASRRLIEFQGKYTDQVSRDEAAAMAVELYLSAGSPHLAGQYLERLDKSSDAYSAARIFYLKGLLDSSGEEPDKLRKEFSSFRKAPWNAFFRMDPAFEAARGIMVCFIKAGKPDKVESARNDFRKEYPERRAGLARLILDEVDYLVLSGDFEKSKTLYGDLSLLFRDVYMEDRVLWTGYILAQAGGDVTTAGRRLESLAENFPWSPYGVKARIRLAHLYVGAGQISRAEALLRELSAPGASTGPSAGTAGLYAEILGAGGRWEESLAQRTHQWSMTSVGEPDGEVLLGWAESALKAGRPAKALELLGGFWSPDPEITARARFVLGLQYQERGELGQALKIMEAASELFHGRSETALKALYQKGLIQEAMGDDKGAVTTYSELENRAGSRSDWARSARSRLRSIEARSGKDPGAAPGKN
ncbi:MAG: tetratricopeptide repeat protein, partial [Gemmatimonadota bacterium]|nr:tetratricopeptide repeat protein [Gemmatimonadota bacterium]